MRSSRAPLAAVCRAAGRLELLPRTNCRECGEATCMAFAFGLLESRHWPAECPSLADPAYATQRLTLAEMLDVVGDGLGGAYLNAL